MESLSNLNPLSIMKTRKLFAAALALPMLFACTKENIVPSEKPVEEGKGFDITVTVNSDNETKAVFDDTDGIFWVTPGSAGLVSTSTTEAAKKSSDATVSEGGRKSAFKFEGITAGTYRLFYPYCETSYPNIKFTVPANQTQDAAGKSSDIFAGMATKDINAAEGENVVDVKYRAVGSYIQFLVYGKEGEKVRFISVVSADSKIAGDYTVDATSESFAHKVLEGGTDRVLVALGDAGYTTTATVDGASGIYAAVLPGSSQNTYYVTTDKATYTFASSEAKPFEAGKIKTVKLNLGNSKVEEQKVPTELYIVGNVAYVGWDCTKAKTMEKNGNVFSTDVYLSTDVKNSDNKLEKAEGFKFLTQNQNFDTGYVKGIDGKLTYYSGTNVEDSKFTVEKAGYYHVVADFDSGEVTCTPKAPEKLYVWGAATTAGWVSEDAIELNPTETGGFVFRATDVQLAANEEFKFFSEHSESTAYVSDADGNVIFFDSPTYSDADRKFKVEKAGKYTISVNLSTGALTKDLTQEYPRIISNNKANTYYMMPTGAEGEYSAVAYIGFDNDYHDFFVKIGDKSYNSGWTEVSFDTNLEYSVDVTEGVDNGTGWYINDANKKTKKLYRITLNTNTNRLTVKFAQGKNFWLIGTPFDGYNAFNKPEVFKETANENGIVTWNVTTTKTGDFKICGEYTLSDSFYDGEWYYSSADDEKFNWSWEGDNNYGKEFPVEVYCDLNDAKWYLNETGTFEIVFDTKNLKIKVTKKN